MEPRRPNIYVVRSVWRRLKKGHIAKVCRDLEPAKDVKGGGGVTDKSKPPQTTEARQAATNPADHSQKSRAVTQ